jgi:hypothetical protein
MRSERQFGKNETPQIPMTCAPKADNAAPTQHLQRRSMIVERSALTITYHARISNICLRYVIQFGTDYHAPDFCFKPFGCDLEKLRPSLGMVKIGFTSVEVKAEPEGRNS